MEVSSLSKPLAVTSVPTRLFQRLSYLARMSTLSSRTRSGPAGFIEPCLPSPADKPPSGANWVHEIKHDGYGETPWASGLLIAILATSRCVLIKCTLSRPGTASRTAPCGHRVQATWFALPFGPITGLAEVQEPGCAGGEAGGGGRLGTVMLRRSQCQR